MKSMNTTSSPRGGHVNFYSCVATVVLAVGLGTCGYLVFGSPTLSGTSAKTTGTPAKQDGSKSGDAVSASKRAKRPAVARKSSQRKPSPDVGPTGKRPRGGRVAADVSKKRKSVPQIPNHINRLKVASGPPMGQAKDTPMMVALETHDPTHPRADYAMLLREIVRQALLVSARDELGLPTRDRTLREPLPAAVSPGRG